MRLINYFILLLFLILNLTYAEPQLLVGKPLPSWQPGYLDIHHIHEGRGNATFMIFPDGTTLLFDIGDVTDSNNPKEYSQILPNNSKTPYEWVADYINQFSPYPGSLDYLIISHYHFDHMGEWNANRPEQREGHYRLFGVTGLFEKIKVRTLIDRSYPDYRHHGDIKGNLFDYLNSNNTYARLTALTMQDYKKFINYQQKRNNLIVEKFQVGSNSQICLKHHLNPNFEVRNIIGNGYVWTGKNSDVYHFIRYAANDINAKKTENDLAIGVRIDYGNFRYFTGSDITGLALTGQSINSSAEAVAAPVIGKVDVATMDHHGFADAQSEIFVSTLRPEVWIQQNWAASQTTLPMLMRTLDPKAYFYHRDLFALNHFQLNDSTLPVFGNSNNSNAINHYYKNSMAHIVVRVMPGGKSYWIILLTSDTNKPIVKAVYGPYYSFEK